MLVFLATVYGLPADTKSEKMMLYGFFIDKEMGCRKKR